MSVYPTTDFIIVGSGCGGAVMASKLAQAGYEVMVVEEGKHHKPEQYTQYSPAESFKKLYRDYGGTMAFTFGNAPTIAIQQGKAVGGSSLINGGVCFRTPDHVMDHWIDDLHLFEFSHEEMNSCTDEVEKTIGVKKTSKSLNSPIVKLIDKAAKKNGWNGHQIDRNMKDCDGGGRCIMACPIDTKQTVLHNYLKTAINHDTIILDNFRVTSLIRDQGRVSGIIGRRYGEIKVKLKARKGIIVAANALNTPKLISTVTSNKQLGKNLSLHPALRMYGVFPQKIEGWKGAFQSYSIDTFRKEGIHLITANMTPSLMLGTLPGFGHKGYDITDELPYMGVFGLMISDKTRGKVGKRLVTYTMNKEDKETTLKGLKILGNLFFDAGATKVYLPRFSKATIRNRGELEALNMRNMMWQQLEVASQHPMGTCKIGKSPGTGVLDPYHKVYGIDNLWVVDSSSVPSSIGVNPQITIMAMATRAANHILEKMK